jgi:hypothetical protein
LRRDIAIAATLAVLGAGLGAHAAAAQSLLPRGSGQAQAAPVAGAPPAATIATPDPNVPRPPGLVPNPTGPAASPPSATPVAPPAPPAGGSAALVPPAPIPLPMTGPSPASTGPATTVPSSTVPTGVGAIAPTARFGRDSPAIISGLHWRVYADKADQGGAFKLIKEEKSPQPVFVLPPGGYVVHAAFGLATASRRVTVRNETVREVFDIPAGGVRFEGRVADARISAGHISFDVYKGGQFETGERRPIAAEIAPSDLVLLPEGTYHVVSNYGDGNAVVRSDFRVQAGKLTDTRINHRAAVITLKLVSEKGGEAIANTAWSVLTPGGDVIKESIGAFPTVVLAEGDYVAIARNEGKVFNREFKVEPGFDREIELLAR